MRTSFSNVNSIWSTPGRTTTDAVDVWIRRRSSHAAPVHAALEAADACSPLYFNHGARDAAELRPPDVDAAKRQPFA